MTLVMESKEERPSATKAPMTPVASPPRPPFAPVESPPRPPWRVKIVSDPRVGVAKTTPIPEALPPLPPAVLPFPPCPPVNVLIQSDVTDVALKSPSLFPNAITPVAFPPWPPMGPRVPPAPPVKLSIVFAWTVDEPRMGTTEMPVASPPRAPLPVPRAPLVFPPSPPRRVWTRFPLASAWAAEPPLPPRPPGPTDVFAAPLPPFPAMIVSMELNETEAAGAALTKTPRATPPSRPFDPEVGPPEPARARTPLIVLLMMFAVAPYQTEIPAANVELTFVILFEETVEVPGCSN